jgi:hypothetical protein
MNPVTAVQFFKQWWFLIAALASITVGGLTFGITLSLRVDQLVKKSAVDDLQWLNIRANTRTAIKHQGRIETMEVHMEPDNIKLWGRVASGWEEDHRALNEHLRNHPRER